MAEPLLKRPLVEVPKPARVPVSSDAAGTARRGLWFLLVALGGFLAWAFFAPLDQGLVGQGTVVVDGERKTVQPLVAGVVDKILVNEGDTVAAGQLLVQLNTVQAQSQLAVTRGKLITARATEARLTAERLKQGQITWPADLLALGDDPRAKAAMALQQNLFTARAAELASRQGIVEHEVASLGQQMKAYQQVRSNYETQLGFQQQELTGLRDLARDGYVPRSKLFEAERNAAQLAGQLASSIGDIGKTAQSINESKLKALQQDQEFRRDAESQLSDVAAEASGYADQIAALEFEVANGALKAPVGGQVLDLTVHTIGGVATAGQALMEVVPLDAPLGVTARFPPMLANKLKPGLPVQVHFTALQRVDTPLVMGTVVTVSADQLIDEQTHMPYFSARIELPPDSLAKLRASGLPVKPGMLADVTVVTGERTLVNYLVKPLRERLLAAFKEE
ncbi:HlyD family type I secretion periplasmic adaptor subunit [Pseudomonas typographi]|uniref:Membrane fusion protein (MFP) family protein n=1 Tax=Pseudomonas typographi TaxID=2715964 RepID=A0ABR7ZA80_9PSED|nr:HlyD family type I secretion periplasmic adaptor subunit [Pseudomonas typographi]MBD1553923.1 HlyD family type I secretion periplasmic adaptor subunit [Pseudomonas typographi]MBD1589675.1 HlyD family type I secretion periplasmic adaptor subunit [Pseudomonas typographi]MBD1602325.1 HlyD family type I secretion periplasmic adaptor subunit [Pseudomonas typographi]